MTSRLDRLFILLESGSSAVTRKAAAKQIGEVQKLHPHELHNLLNRLIVYLHSSSWDTRIAAAHAVESILKNVPQWNPVPSLIKNECTSECQSKASEASRLCFENFNLDNVLEKGARLMGSEGTEFDFQDELEGDTERIIRQRAVLNEKLGLNRSKSLGITIDDIVTLEDMKIEQQNKIENSQRLIPVQDILNFDCIQSSSQSLSCREKNRAKRKARQNQTVIGNNLSRSNSCSDLEPEKKKIKNEIKKEIGEVSIGSVPDGTGSWGDSTDWPLEAFCSKLYIDLFSPRWETRHGAATALRELLKSHINGAGKSAYMTSDEMEVFHLLWLEDVVLRLLCVLALDRFGDFVSDQVVAPVRETCAQVLGAVLKEMPIGKVENTVTILRQLIKQKEWEVRHGGLLGIKYMLVVREDLLQIFLPSLINDILRGLFDPVDDVGAVAACTLVPIATWLPKLLNHGDVSNIVKMLWDLLLDQDELTSACNSFMGLLAAILSLPNASTWIQMESMSILVPRLWPFLSHSTSSVRKSTLQTLKTLTENTTITEIANEKSTDSELLTLNFGVKSWPADLLQEALRHIFQRVLVEHINEIQELVVLVWNNLVINAELSALLHAACPYVTSWMCLAMQPVRLAFEPTSLIYANTTKKPKQNDLETEQQPNLCYKMYLGGIETVPSDIRERNVIRARCKSSEMLGLLSRYLVLPAPGMIYTADIDTPIQCYTKVFIPYLNSRSALQRLICSMVVSFWALCNTDIRPGPPELQEKLKTTLLEYVYYDEVAHYFTRLLQESRDFLATLKQYKVPIVEFDHLKILSLDQINLLSTTMTENLRSKYSLKPKIADLLEERRRSLFNSYKQTSYEQNTLNINVQSALAGASVCLNSLPEKLNPVIKPIMESIKREECELLQRMSAKYLVHLLEQIADRNPCPNNKIITNLTTLLKSDADFTPKIVSFFFLFKKFFFCEIYNFGKKSHSCSY